jgi:hypothetical protein
MKYTTAETAKKQKKTQFGSPERQKVLEAQNEEKAAVKKALDNEFKRLERRGAKVTQRDVMDGLTVSFMAGGGFERLSKLIRRSETAFLKVTELFLKHKVPINTVLELDVRGNFLKIPAKQPSALDRQTPIDVQAN